MAKSTETTIYQEIKTEIGRQMTGPLYQQITQKLAERIERGELIAGQPLPRQRAFGKLLGVGEVTVRRALKNLQAKGLVVARQGSGTVVAPPGKYPGHTFGRSATHPADRRLRFGVVSLGSTDGYPFIQPLIKALDHLGRNAQRSPQGIVWSQHYLPFHPHDHPLRDTQLREALPLDQLDGLVMMSPVSVPLIAACQQLTLPYVLAFNDLADGRSACVVVDYGSALLDAVTQQAQNGARRFALMTSQRDRFSTGRLVEAFALALRANAIDPAEAPVIAAGYHPQHGTTATQQLLADGFNPDSIFYASTPQAIGGSRALFDAGLEVGSHVQITAITGEPDEALPFDWMVLPLEAFAQSLSDALSAAAQRQSDDPRLVSVRCRYVHRD